MNLFDGFVTIKNDTGLTKNTKIILSSGEELKGVTAIDIKKFTCRDQIITANITIMAKVDLKAFINEIEQEK